MASQDLQFADDNRPDVHEQTIGVDVTYVCLEPPVHGKTFPFDSGDASRRFVGGIYRESVSPERLADLDMLDNWMSTHCGAYRVGTQAYISWQKHLKMIPEHATEPLSAEEAASWKPKSAPKHTKVEVPEAAPIAKPSHPKGKK